MRRRLTSAVLIVVLLVQAFVIAPATLAANLASHSAVAGGCDHQGVPGPHECPCCPDGGVMAAGCMSLCTAFASVATLTLPLLKPVPDPAIPFDEPSSSSQTYPPLNPPPIA